MLYRLQSGLCQEGAVLAVQLLLLRGRRRVQRRQVQPRRRVRVEQVGAGAAVAAGTRARDEVLAEEVHVSQDAAAQIHSLFFCIGVPQQQLQLR